MTAPAERGGLLLPSGLAGEGRTREYPGLVQRFVPLPGGELVLNAMAPGAVLVRHYHPEEQFGFAVRGGFEILAGRERVGHRIEGRRAYTLASNVPHGARQGSAETVISIDLKLLPMEPAARRPEREVTFHRMEHEDTAWGRLLVRSTRAWVCRLLVMNPHQKVTIEDDAENFTGARSYLALVEDDGGAEGRPGWIFRLPPGRTVLRSADESLTAVHLQLLEPARRDMRPPSVESPAGSRYEKGAT